MTRTSQFSGNWSVASNWNPVGVPTAADDVIINSGNTITVDTNAAALSLDIGGTLKFSRVVPSTLTLSGLLDLTGELDMGKSGDPITAVTARLVLASGPGVVFRVPSNSGGVFTTHGGGKSPVARASAGFPVGPTSVVVPAAEAAGWAVGDWITIGQTGIPPPPQAWEDRTERVRITAITGTDPLTVSWSGALAYSHDSGNSTRVANLTRNVVVSGGSGSTGDWNIQGNSTGDIKAVQTEFTGAQKLYFTNGADDILFSSCSIHDLDAHVEFDSLDRASIRNNVVYNNEDYGFRFNGTGEVSILDNDIFGTNGRGLFLDTGDGFLIRGNHVYSNANEGMYVKVKAVIRDNRIYANDGPGVHLVVVDGSALSGNWIYRNNADGIAIEDGSGQHLIASNRIHSNTGGFYIADNGGGATGGDVVINNSLYDNGLGTGGAALFLNNFNFQESRFQGNRFGYDATGGSLPDAKAIDSFAGRQIKLDLRGNRVNPASAVISTSAIITQPGSFLLTINHNLAQGTVHLYGDYTLSGSTMTLDKALPLYASSATAVRLMRGTGHTASVTSTNDAGAVDQLITIRCLDGGSDQWQVEGSESGLLYGPFTGDLSGQAIGGQFHLTFDSNSAAAQTDDILLFGLLSSSQDAGVQKKLLFGNVGGTLNNGKSRFSVSPGAGLVLKGSSSLSTDLSLVDRISATGNYYTLVSSGAFTAANARVRNADLNGIQLSGSGGVSMSSSTFDFMGVGSGETGSYITARALTSNATFYNMTFGVSRSTVAAGAAAAYGVRVQGADAGLRWFFWGHNGGFDGDANDFDPNDKILWSETTPPGTPPAFTAAGGAAEGSLTLSWTSPGDDGLSNPIVGGQFLIFQTTTAALATAATAAQAQTVISTNAAALSAHGQTLSNLEIGKNYYFRLWAADEFNNITALPAATTGQAQRLTPTPAGSFAGAAAGSQISLTWTAPAAPPLAYRGAYTLEATTVSAGGPFAFLASIPAGDTAYMHATPLLETTYYYRLYTTDVLGGPAGTSSPAAATGRTADILSPQVALSVGPRTVGVAWSPALTLSFTKSMNAASVANALTITRLRNHLAEDVTEPPVSVTVTPNPSNDVFQITGFTLDANSLYEMRVATTAVDALGKALAAPGLLQWTTLLDHTANNVVIDDASGARVSLPPLSLKADGYVSGAGGAAGTAAATQKLISSTGDPLRSPVGGAVTLEPFTAAGAPQGFATPVTASLPFADTSPADGIVDGTQVHVKTLAIYWLDPARRIWVRLNSAVDPSRGMVSARVPRSSTLALIGSLNVDVEGAWAFPSPWKASAGVPAITFAGVGQGGQVEVFAVTGERIARVSDDDMDGLVDWDVRGQDGAPAAGGVYFYRVKNGDQEKTGKLAVIR